MDCDDWTRKLPLSLGAAATVRLRELFAPGGVFSDPVTPPTTDIASVEDITDAFVPRLEQEVLRAHGDSSGGAFEWVGRGTLGGTTRIEMHGCTMVELDGRRAGHPLARLLRSEGDRDANGRLDRGLRARRGRLTGRRDRGSAHDGPRQSGCSARSRANRWAEMVVPLSSARSSAVTPPAEPASQATTDAGTLGGAPG